MHVAIIGLGPTADDFLDTAKRAGGRRAFCDEVWGINQIGDVFACDRVFHMDDVRIQEIRAAARPDSNIAAMLRWLKTYTGPVVTSRAHPDYPCLVEFPLEQLINKLGYTYLNSTAAFAVAYAVLIGVTKISLWGLDFTYPNRNDAEKGRGCVEFWLGQALARGVKVTTSQHTSLLDALVPWPEKLYGYDTLDVTVTPESDRVRVEMTPKTLIQTAAEIEHRYDHSRHPNAIFEAQETNAGGMRPGERQVSPTRKGIRRDHLARYEFAARTLPPGSRVLDLACGVGYGSRILAEVGHTVIGLDVDANAIAYAQRHYAHERASFREFDASRDSIEQLGAQDAAVCFETIEHIEDPRPMLKQFSQTCAKLIASVPNESVFPWKGHAYHFRHYTQEQFRAVLAECGWHVTSWLGQAGTDSDPVPDQNGRTLIAVAERAVAKGGLVRPGPYLVGERGPEFLLGKAAGE